MSEPMSRRRSRAPYRALAYASATLISIVALGGLGGCASATGSAGRAGPSPAAGVAGSSAPSEAAGRRSPTPPAQLSAAARAAATATRLSDVDLVGQVLVPYAFGQAAGQVTAAAARANKSLGGVATPAELVSKFHLGGMILVSFGTGDPTATTNETTNIVSAAQVRQLTTGLQAAAAKLPAAAPLLIGTDQEYGVVTRLKSGVVQLPSALALGAADDPALTKAAWAAAGADLAAVGLNVDFAPDADVLAGAGNTVIGSRSFGGVPAAVSAQVTAAVSGLQAGGVAATIKHFPGHGDTDTDSHVALPVLRQSLAQLTADDLAPFRAGIAAGTDMIMSGHLNVTSIDPGVPASFSHKVLTDLLRGKMGYTGVVITDALNMAPAEKWSPGEAAVRAVLAGNDMLLMPPNIAAAQRGLLGALKSGRLPRARLVASVTRILTLKYRLAAQSPAKPLASIDSAAARAAAAAVGAKAITMLRGPCAGRVVPGTVTVASAAGHGSDRAWLATALRADGVSVADKGGAVIDLVGYGDGRDDLAAGATVTVAMDTPYVLGAATSPVRMATYSTTRASMIALAAVIAGKAAAGGLSPVAVAGLPRTACPPRG